MRRKRFCITLCAILGFVPAATDAAEIYHTSARAAGMGSAFLASYDEAAAVFSNPAGLAAIPEPEIFCLYGKPLAGLPGVAMWSGDIAVALPFTFGHFGLGYSVFQADGLLREQAAALAYGQEMWQGLRAGITLKYLFHDYLIGNDPLATIDPVFNHGTSRGVFSVDLGALWSLERILPLGSEQGLAWGMALRNLNEPDWGLASEDRVLLEGQTGLLWAMKPWGFTATADVLFRNTGAGQMREDPLVFFGVQKTFFDRQLAVRLGANPLEITGGFGVNWGPWVIDYAAIFKFNLLSDNFGSHKVGLTFRFGPEPATPAAELHPSAGADRHESGLRPQRTPAGKTKSSMSKARPTRATKAKAKAKSKSPSKGKSKGRAKTKSKSKSKSKRKKTQQP